MQIVSLPHTKIWIASDFREDEPHSEFFERHVAARVRMMLRRRLFRDIVERNSRLYGLSGFAMLDAHRVSSKCTPAQYWFSDGKVRCSVQNWIDRIDGSFAAILLWSCGTKRVRVRSEKSVIIHATEQFNMRKMSGNRVNLLLFLPGSGYLGGNQYELRKAHDSLSE